MAGGTPERGGQQGGQRGGQRIVAGRYRLVRKLGAGGMGRVWLAYDQELAIEVSIKEIVMPEGTDAAPVDDGERAERIARARSEARNAARLRGHPHVVTVHDVVVDHGLPWIVMEFVPDAVDLQSVVRSSGPLPPDETARIGLAVLDALAFGHRIGVLHRDVKPANILLAPDDSGPYGRVLLTDYGIALQPGSNEPRLTATAGILGTPGYLAPERARGDPPTPAADFFSLGATLYSAVEGRGAFDRPDDYAMLTALLTEPPAPPVRAGELLGPVLLGLLTKNPVRRSAPETVARGLERVRQGPVAGFGPVLPYGGGGTGSGGPPSGTVPLGRGVSTPGGTPQGSPYEPPNPYPYEPNPYAAMGVGGLGGGTPSTPGTPVDGPGVPGAPGAPDGGRPKHRRGVVLGAAVAALLAIGGGTWAVLAIGGDEKGGTGAGGAKSSAEPAEASASPSDAGGGSGELYPYGETVGLTKPLGVGDCVSTVWFSKPFTGRPNIGTADCATGVPDGQVMTVEKFDTAQEAKRDGAELCRGRTRSLVAALPDAAPYALIPTAQGFDTAGGQVVCLVLGRSTGIGSEVGRFRDTGLDLPVSGMAVGDCWTYKQLKDTWAALLTDCANPHTDQVIGSLWAPAGMAYQRAVDNANKLCGNKFEPVWAPGDKLSVNGSMAGASEWNTGFRKVVCTVGRADRKAESGTLSPTGG
ncbi:serine/threonine-protein kinase [Streptomyces sp. NPDC021093]|uniref:serine/threonine-protein kinase n=1 Tax=Streptomyces sp. NPDC021093 TaxID=3365112 RepID=UPI0037A1FAE2